MKRNCPETEKFFSFTTYNSLLSVLRQKADAGDEDAAFDLKDVEAAAVRFKAYVECVDNGETQIKIAYARKEGDDLRKAIMDIDTARRNFHEGAISRVSLVNNIARGYGFGPIFMGSREDRYQVADFCLEVAVALFNYRES